MVTWQREIGERDDYTDWQDEVTGLLKDRATPPFIYDGLGPDEEVGAEAVVDDWGVGAFPE